MKIEFSLPNSQKDFLSYYNPEIKHSPHWRRVREMLKLLEEDTLLPSRLVKLRDVLKESLKLEESEKTMAGHVTDKLENMFVMQGLVTVYVTVNFSEPCSDFFRVSNFSFKDVDVVGHQLYSSCMSQYDDYICPDWVGNVWYKDWRILCGLGFFERWKYKREIAIEKELLYKKMELDYLPSCLGSDIIKATEKYLEDISKDRKIWNLFKKKSRLSVSLQFRYSNEGLSICFFSMSVKDNEESVHLITEEAREDQDKKINSLNERVDAEVINRHSTELGSRFFQMLRRWDPEIGKEFVSFESSLTDMTNRWFALDKVLSSSTFVPIVDAVVGHREFFYSHIIRLKEVVDLVDIQIKASEVMKSPLTLPKLIFSEHLLCFEDIFPVRLLYRDDVTDYVRITNIPPIISQSICLTGAHAGGKTTASFAVAENLFLAQSGLLVFGTNFTWNVKRHIGIIVSERGAGSKAELLLQKLGNVVDSLNSVAGSEVLLIFDEMGTGTQEDAGLSLGKDVLRALSSKGMSLLFNTQIQDLALWAHKEVGAVCLYVDNERFWHLGVRDGGLKQLRETSGFDSKLKQFSKS